MNRRTPRAFLGLIAALLAPAAIAQGTSVLTGTIVDAESNQPVPDVVVTATSPSLQGEQNVLTDSAGSFRIPQLPPGTYVLRFSHSDYQPMKQPEVVLRLDSTVRANVKLAPSVLREEILVEGVTATIDVASASTGVTLDSDFTRRIPVSLPTGKGAAARTFDSLAEIAPGAQTDLYGTSISGTTSPENGFVLDGTTVNDPGFGINGTSLTVDFIDEVKVITGGYLPEYGRATGGVITAVTKSGSNEFHGSVFGNLTPGPLVAAGTEIRQEAGTVSGNASLWNVGDFGFELGGPIVKDRLWFFAGVAPSFTRYAIDRQLNAIQVDGAGTPLLDEEGNQVTAPIPGTAQRFFADQRMLQYIGKLTYNLNADHNLSVTVNGTPNLSGGEGRYAISDRTGTPEVVNAVGQYSSLASSRWVSSLDVAAKWAGSFLEKRLLVDASVGYHHQARDIRASDGTSAGETTGLGALPQVLWTRTEGGQHSIVEFEQLPDPSVCGVSGELCPVLNYFSGGPGFLSDITMDRLQGRGVVTGLFSLGGHHVFKAGVDLEQARFQHTKAYTGRVIYAESDDGTYFQDFRQFGYLDGPDQAVVQQSQTAHSVGQNLGAFLQDSWSVADLFLVNAGLRYDTQILEGGGARALILAHQLSPRLGVIYDPTQRGASKVFANFARYFESVPLDIVDRQFPGERQLVSLKDAGLCDPRDPVQAATVCMSDEARLEWRGATDANRLWGVTGGTPTIVDPALKAQSSDELVVGGETELWFLPAARAGVTYTHRQMNSVIEDMSRDDGATYFIGNPGEGFATDFERPVRDYDAVTVYLNRDFGNSWLAQASYTWSTLRGNYEGLFRADTGQLDPNINSDFDLPSLLANRTGPLPADRAHQIKLFAAKEFQVAPKFTVNLGGSYRGVSGTPTNYLGAHEIYGAGEAYLLPRGAGERLPWVHRVDAQLGLNYRLGKDQVVTVSADVFNLFNFQAVTAVDENYTFSEARPIDQGTPADLGNLTDPSGSPLPSSAINPNFGRATAYQSPRSIRLGARITF